ncbi:uncharacterized protein Eint_021080 [Encephalitozoon intestinalis ATCC 50506]|uniref:MIF4G domain-containing protein n=1 Tax=Encephalitozoon intestinalis (strain ATCC 50506) TaxID=876142 RepID=E0S5X0_ENCIT|nr:uncharacterized protein Eint_021080 [Encephalitozoon intestinalis ATCC 50506]ADM11105.1 hypothetical protein Eint_021080 [Encephalitozoon intestinalis ATCC 50506]UTX44759.1 hypothetical protein GPK93_02g02790 [Encephalitozoon intestinalis]
MNWEDELMALGVPYTERKRNSPLRKKLSIIKKLKNINSESVEAIKSDLEKEDMSKFTSEIVTSILLSKVQSTDDIKSVVRVTSALTSCSDFMRLLMSELGKIINHGIEETEKYWLAAFFFDLQTLSRRTVDKEERRENLIRDLCNKISEKPRILFLGYIMENYKDELSQAEVSNQAKRIDPQTSEDRGGRLDVVARSLGIKVCDEGYDLKKMADVENEEFHYYTGRTASLECYDGGLDIKEIRDYIIMHSGDTEKLDALSKSIKNVNNQKEVVFMLMQLKLNPNFISSIARILKNMGAVARKVVAVLFREIYQAKNPSHNDVISNCLLISEMCKFREVSSDEMFGLLDYLFKTKNIEAYCMCLNGIGRYFLLNEATSHRIREFIERIRNYRASKVDFVHVNNCLSRLFSPSQSILCADYTGFFRYFFRKEAFDGDSLLWSCLIKSKATLMSIFLHPWVFEDIDFLASVVHKAEISMQVMNVIIPSIEIMYGYSKHKSISLARLYSSLMLLENKDTWAYLVDRALQLKVGASFRCKIAMMLLQKMPIDMQRQYFSVLRDCVNKEESLDLKILFTNFCESIGMEAPTMDYDDSFDEELNFVRSYA